MRGRAIYRYSDYRIFESPRYLFQYFCSLIGLPLVHRAPLQDFIVDTFSYLYRADCYPQKLQSFKIEETICTSLLLGRTCHSLPFPHRLSVNSCAISYVIHPLYHSESSAFD